MVLGETGSWSELANHSATMPADARNGADGSHRGAKSHGMLGFLSRRAGRDRSPKPKESGVLGKEGARVVINSGRGWAVSEKKSANDARRYCYGAFGVLFSENSVGYPGAKRRWGAMDTICSGISVLRLIYFDHDVGKLAL